MRPRYVIVGVDDVDRDVKAVQGSAVVEVTPETVIVKSAVVVPIRWMSRSRHCWPNELSVPAVIVLAMDLLGTVTEVVKRDRDLAGR